MIPSNPSQRTLTSLHESHAPVDALAEALHQQALGDVALGHTDRSHEVAVVDRVQDHLDVALQEVGLDEVAGLLRVRHLHGRIGPAVSVQLQSRTTDARDHDRHVVVVGQQQSAHRRPIAHMLDDGLQWLAVLLLYDGTRVLLRPLDVAHVLRGIATPLALAGSLGLVLESGQLGHLGCLGVLAAHTGQTLGDQQLGDVDGGVGVRAEEDGAIVAGGVGGFVGREVDLGADQLLAQELTGLPGIGLVEDLGLRVGRRTAGKARGQDVGEVDLFLWRGSIPGLATYDNRVTAEDLSGERLIGREEINIYLCLYYSMQIIGSRPCFCIL